jgi:hypothetical protein
MISETTILLHPLSAAGEERVDQSPTLLGRVSQYARQAMAVMSAGLTHPVIALLDHPLFRFAGKRVAAIIFSFGYPIFLTHRDAQCRRSVLNLLK